MWLLSLRAFETKSAGREEGGRGIWASVEGKSSVGELQLRHIVRDIYFMIKVPDRYLYLLMDVNYNAY